MNRLLSPIGCLLLAALIPAHGAAQTNRKELKEFYVAIDAVSDAGPHWFKYVLHVEPVADGTRVRYIRVAPPDAQCQKVVTVKAAQAVLKDVRVWKVAGDLNLCNLTQQEVDVAIKPYRYPGVPTIWDTAAYGIVAKCGTEEKLLRLPYEDEVKFDRLTKERPKIKALYGLAYDVRGRAFGGKSPLHDLSPAQDIAVQEEGRLFLDELRSGRFDRGFWKTFRGGRPGAHFSMREVLEDYRGVYVPAPREGKLVDPAELVFLKYVPPEYPAIARMALVQGNVSLLVTASPQDGSVQDVKVLSGHKLLQSSAVEAARGWVFKPGQGRLDGPITVTLEYSFHCPKL